jgi:glucan biosynthesis protein C
VQAPRYNDLDALRAFAMLVVILFHVGRIAGGLRYPGGEPVESALEWFTSTAHDFQMPVFFMMSGFFGALVVSRSGTGSFMRGRLTRIGIPLVVGWLLMAPVLNALGVWGQELRGHGGSVTLGLLFGEKLHHLWFLWYLLMYCVVVLATRALAARAPAIEATARRWFAALVASRWKLFVLVPLTAAMLWPTDMWTAAVPPVFTPHLEPFVYHLAFFAFGWLLFGQRELLVTLRRAPVAYTVVALVASVAALVVLDNRGADPGDAVKLAVIVLTGLVTWSAILALLGWFHRWFAAPNPRVRYMADAAYWLYLGHLPLVLAMYYGLTEVGVPFPIKLIVVPVATVGMLLLMYERFVRYTGVGEVLHGRRERPPSSQPVAAPG